ncbi:InlB B-repeat-containing protein [Myceligenerans xiligouense]|uniref:LPXTG-motif cell wall-anchored protein n=1 Tax=Myceligenerans xiligouense TaxID=253184 RepID=A0A3N4YMW7_9MICO|nr:hypothetical protein [Myceligenerans xiligouense]RPF20674.1 hypothetical protein EDD34_1271 [Myceligenerans xiligouense]
MKLMRHVRRSGRHAAVLAGAALLVGGLGAVPAAADDTVGPGPAAGDIDQPIFRAANPDTYTTADPSGADTSDVVTQLTSGTRIFECGDTIVYFQVVPVDDDAPDGESTVTLSTEFETRFGNNDQVGITEVEAFLATDDSSWSSDSEETISGTFASGTWSDGELVLVSTVDDVEAGETIVVEYHATLTCGNPPGDVNGNLHASNLGIQVCQDAGEGDCGSTGGGMQTVPLFANAVLVTVVPEYPEVTQSECVDGEATEPTIVLPEDGALLYTADPEGPYEPGQEVVVTATLTQGYTWGELPEGWMQVSDTEAEYVVILEDIDCDQVVVPEYPMVTQAECVDGEATEPTIVLPEDNGLAYMADPEGPYEPGQEVMVTATLNEGYIWGELPEGWEQVSDTEAVYWVMLDDIDCDQVIVPEYPVVTQSECVDGWATEPTVMLPEDNGLAYMADPEGPYEPGQEVMVTATLNEGYIWGELPEGWEQVSDTEAVYWVMLDDIDCDQAVVPEYPMVKQAKCVHGEATEPKLKLPEDGALVYMADPEGPYEPGQKVMVTATLTEGYIWGELPEGWKQVSDTEAVYWVYFDKIDCDKPVEPKHPDRLAATGPVEPGMLSGAAGVLALAGAMLILARRRLTDVR